MGNLVSVIIPVYNREEYIEECLNSVLSQSYENFEIIIIDDGSDDRSFEICERFAENDERVKLFKGEHKGVSAARNKALDIANGDYVIFVDSDDVIHPELLKSLTDAVVQTAAEIAGTHVMNISESKWDTVRDIIAKDSGEARTEHKPNLEAIKIMLSGPSPINLAGGTMLKRSLIAETRFRTDLFIAEDFYFIYENLVKGANAVFVNPKRYYSRIHKTNSSWVYDFSGFFTRFERRRLVWQNEEKCGRTENANLQKIAAVATFSTCAKRHEKADSEVKKMSAVLRKYKKELLPALNLKSKIFFLLNAYLPFTYFLIKKIKKR